MYECASLNDRNARKISYKCDIEKVFVPCEFECDVSIHRIVKIDDHNSQRDMRMVAHARVSYSVYLDTFVASLGLVSMALDFVDKLVIESHDPCWSPDCIRPTVRKLH